MKITIKLNIPLNIINFENLKIITNFTFFFILKNYISRYMYVLTTQEVYIHIPNTIESIYIDLHERQMTQGVYMYILKFGKINIYMK